MTEEEECGDATRMVELATSGLLSATTGSRLAACSGINPVDMSAAEVVPLASERGNNLLFKAGSKDYEPEVAIQNGDYITVVYKRVEEGGAKVESPINSQYPPVMTEKPLGEAGDVANSVVNSTTTVEDDEEDEDEVSEDGQERSMAGQSQQVVQSGIDCSQEPYVAARHTPAEASVQVEFRSWSAVKRILKAPPLCTSTPVKSRSTSHDNDDDSSSESTSNQSTTSQSGADIGFGARCHDREVPSTPKSVVSTNYSSIHSNKERRPFTKNEIRKIYSGVSTYGENDWKSIHMAYLATFHKSRTAVKLYDKWRKQLSRYPDASSYFERKVKKDLGGLYQSNRTHQNNSKP